MIAVSVHLQADPHVRILPFTGEDMKMLLRDFGSISFRSDSVFLYSSQSRMVQAWGMDEFRGIIYYDALQEGLNDNYMQSLHIEGNTLYVEELSCPMAYIYSLAGQLIQSIPIQSGKGTVSVASLSGGVYIIVAGHEMQKMIIR